MTPTFQNAKMTKVYSPKLMQNISLYIYIVFGVWLLVLSIFLYRFLSFYKRLVNGVEVGDIKKILENLGPWR